MRKILSYISIIFVLAFSACKVQEVDPNVAGEVVGTYVVTSYVSQAGASSGDLSNNKVVVTRVDDTYIKIVIDYPAANDVEADNVYIERGTSKYVFTKYFTNASLRGTIEGDKLNYQLNYSDGDFVFIEAWK